MSIEVTRKPFKKKIIIHDFMMYSSHMLATNNININTILFTKIIRMLHIFMNNEMLDGLLKPFLTTIIIQPTLKDTSI